jgi:4-hydroxyphenylpyruvate dioxygenase
MSYKLAISSMSLGRTWAHNLPEKLNQAAAYKYQGIELFYEDLEHLAKSYPGGLTDANRLEAARQIRQMCDARHLKIIGLQPLMHYEGLLDREEHARQVDSLKMLFQIMRILGADILLIPSNFLQQGISGDQEMIVQDLLEIAELGLRETPVVRFAYENLCWGTFVNTWEQAWAIVAAVDKPNFGICLDTFNVGGSQWADPSSPDGKIANADAVLCASLKRLAATIDVAKVFYIQVADAERMRDPVVPGHTFFIDSYPARMGWSRNARLFPFEKPGYLPIVDILKAFTGPAGLGFHGWVSMELFSRTMADPDPLCPARHARRGMESWMKLLDVMGWETDSEESDSDGGGRA